MTQPKLRDLIPKQYANIDLGARIKKVAKEIQHDRKKINILAEQYNEKYSTEIAEGTKQKQLLLSEGLMKGLTEEEAHKYVAQRSGYIPSSSTPILNWLYFFMNEHRDVKSDDNRKQLNEQIKSQVDNLSHEEVNVMEHTPDLFEYMYGNLTLEIFSKLKKLKVLSRSSNENEAFQAYRKCLQLCEEYKVDFDRIPTVFDKKSLK